MGRQPHMRKRSLTRPQICSTTNLDCQTSSTVRNKALLLRSRPVCGLFVTTAQRDWDITLLHMSNTVCGNKKSTRKIYERKGGRWDKKNLCEKSTQRLQSHSRSGNTTPEESGVQRSTIHWESCPQKHVLKCVEGQVALIACPPKASHDS